MNTRMTIEMPEEMLRQLAEHAAEAGTGPDVYVRDLIGHHLEDLEDIAAAEAAMERLQSGKSRTYTLDEVVRELGLDD